MSDYIKGGEFLIKKGSPEDIFIPYEMDEEQKMIYSTCEQFLDSEVFPNLDAIDKLQEGLMPSLLDKAGELGMLGISIPEEYAGFGKDFITGMLATEACGPGHSFSVAFAAHTGIGTLPILYYGNKEQKQKYIPKLASGEWKASYCLTEPNAGSDANSGKTKAVLTDDGKHYIINGQKMWITNGGFADVFTVFAKIGDDKNLSAFIVDANTEGVSLNPEEKKMGIKGSSTVQVFFNDVKVPVENMLSEQGNGFKIALNILNIGRIKLAGATLGAAKKCITHAIVYANERSQFGTKIANFGAIQSKIAKMATKVYALESATYRCSKSIQRAIESLEASGLSKEESLLKGVEQFAAEAAILKVHGSETLDFCVDEAVQIYGGMGYSAESPVERMYRDSRINRIFEGTNEINRLLTVDMLIRKTMKGELDLMTPAMKVAEELMEIPDFGDDDTSVLDEFEKTNEQFKKAVLLVAGAGIKAKGMELKDEQEIVMNIADLAIESYISDSLVLRLRKIESMGKLEEYHTQLGESYLFEAADRMFSAGKEAIWSMGESDELRMAQIGVKRFTKVKQSNIHQTRQAIAKMLLNENKYNI